MPLGPVFRHELLAAGRKRRYFWARVLVGLGMLLLLSIAYQSVVDESVAISDMAQLSSIFYGMFAGATMLGVLLITPAIVAGAIATERERRTIEYLFATDLSNSEIVLDKIVARLLVVAKLVLATLPVLAIFRLLGGVPWSLLITHFAMLASTATLTAAMALTVGVWCERGRDAVPRAVGLVFLWLAALPLAFLVSSLLTLRGTPLAEWLNLNVMAPSIQAMAAVHPLMMLIQSSGVMLGSVLGIDLDRWAIARMVLVHLVAAAGFLALSVMMVRRVHLNAAAKPGVRLKAVGGGAASRSPYEKRPMLWKEMFAASVRKRGTGKWVKRLGIAILLIAIGTPLAVVLYGAVTGQWEDVDHEAYMGVATGIVTMCGSILVLLIGSRAAGLVTYEHERDTLVSLLSTPLESADIVSAKTWGNIYAYRWQLIGLVLIPLLSSLIDIVRMLSTAGVTASVGVLAWAAAAIGLAIGMRRIWPLSGLMLIPLLGALVDLTVVGSTLGVLASLAVLSWAATAIGLAISMRMKNSIKAIGATMLVMLSIGVFYSMVVGIFVVLMGPSGEELAVLVYPPLAPFLIAFPLITSTESHTPDLVYASYYLGLAFYAALGLVFTVSNRRRFDQVNGRSPERVATNQGHVQQPAAV